MKWYKTLFGAGLLGLSCLAGCRSKLVNEIEEIKRFKPHIKNETSLELWPLFNGKWVKGKIRDVEVSYFVSDRNTINLSLSKDGIATILINDGGEYADITHKRHICAVDGNINYFCLVEPHYPYHSKNFFCKDDGNSITRLWAGGFTEEEIETLRKWGNEKLYEVQEICKEKFGDRLKIPYKERKKPKTKSNLDELLENFDF